MRHVLDRPVWSALSTRHASLAEGGALARRYDPSTVPFAAARDDTPQTLEALAALLPPPAAIGDADPASASARATMLLVQADPIVMPPGCVAVLVADVVQMVLRHTPPSAPDPRIERLTAADAAEMLALATLTRPGPFTLRAQALGEFWGVKEEGRLIAMAGERMKQEGYAEVSGVCVHPQAQGRGLGRLLSVFMTHRVLARGETPYLHAYATNVQAIRLYETIGYELRTMMNAAMIGREQT